MTDFCGLWCNLLRTRLLAFCCSQCNSGDNGALTCWHSITIYIHSNMERILKKLFRRYKVTAVLKWVTLVLLSCRAFPISIKLEFLLNSIDTPFWNWPEWLTVSIGWDSLPAPVAQIYFSFRAAGLGYWFLSRVKSSYICIWDVLCVYIYVCEFVYMFCTKIEMSLLSAYRLS